MAAARLLDDVQRRDWLRLLQSENVGPATFRQLINRFGSAAAALAALPELSARGGLRRPIAIYPADAAERDLANSAKAGARFIAIGEAGYPKLLRHIEAAPPLLCIKGETALADTQCVAIVGARNASAAGRSLARELAADLGAAGLTIVSGLARGIDTAAHETALSRGTVAVIAAGIDVTYPPENEKLQNEVARLGLLVTEMMPGSLPKAEHFPRRNRIISGICLGVIIVEAALRSGSLITARLAGEQGREVFAVPGSPRDPRAEGTNRLIREGATLVTGAQDVLDVLGPAMVGRLSLPEPFMERGEEDGTPDYQGGAGEGVRDRLVALLGPAPVSIDDLIRESGLSPSLVLTLLLELDLAGRLLRHGRQRVSLRLPG